MNWRDASTQTFARWVRAFERPSRELAAFRIFFAGYFLLFGVPQFTWIGKNPDSFFHPPYLSFAVLFDGFPGTIWLHGLSVLVCVLFIALLFGFRTRSTSLLLSTALLIGHMFHYSFGKIDHDILAWILPGLMAFSGWGSTYSIDSRAGYAEPVPPARSWSVALVGLAIATGFFSAGLPKLVHWIDLDLGTQGVRSWIVNLHLSGEVTGVQEFVAAPLYRLESPLAWEMIDALVVAFELGMAASIVRPRYFRFFCGVALLFHAANYLILDVHFVEYAPIYFLFLDWSLLGRGTGMYDWLERRSHLFSTAALGGVVSAYVPVYLLAQHAWSPPGLSTDASILSAIIGGWAGIDYVNVRAVVIWCSAAALAGVYLWRWVRWERRRARSTVLHVEPER